MKKIIIILSILLLQLLFFQYIDNLKKKISIRKSLEFEYRLQQIDSIKNNYDTYLEAKDRLLKVQEEGKKLERELNRLRNKRNQ